MFDCHCHILPAVDDGAAKLQIKLQLGCELYAPLLAELSFAGIEQFCIEGSNRLLLEFHPRYLPDSLPAFINEIRGRNIVPIIAHPERYGLVQENPAILQDVIQLGCFLQINGRSLCANPLDRCSNTAKKLLKLYPAAFLSSDAHCPEHYQGLAKAQQKYGRMRRELP